MLRFVAAAAATLALALPASAAASSPVVVLTSPANPYSTYVGEIMHAEGLNGFDQGTLGAVDLSRYDVAVLGDVPVDPAQASALASWVAGGGDLIALSPDPDLAGLLGIAPAGGGLDNGYLHAPGTGIVSQPIQYHGRADYWALNGAAAVATLYSTPYPAVTLRSFGAGQAAAFTFDLARSVVLTRQGNPAWAGQERDGADGVRPSDMFVGGWLNLAKIHIPQADELQRLFANLLTGMGDTPVPRFWYLPRGERAAVVMTGDDHDGPDDPEPGGTEGRFEHYKDVSPPGCSVANWECVRSTSYVYADNQLTNAQAMAYEAQGFELALHPHAGGGCPDFDFPYEDLDEVYDDRLDSPTGFKAEYPNVTPPRTARFHCVAWPDWSSHARVEREHGIRLDTNYYHYPPAWGTRPGYMTGSGEIMRFAAANGAPLDIYQAHTHVNDEWIARDDPTQTAAAIKLLLDQATGPQGYYGIFTANMHTDDVDSPGSDAILAAARARSVPIISARQALDWVTGRDASRFRDFTWSAGRLGFTVTVGAGANGLRGMLPLTGGGGPLAGLTRDGAPVPVAPQTVKGVRYGFFDARPGRYEAVYDIPQPAPPAARVDRTAPLVTVRQGRRVIKRGLRLRVRRVKMLRRGLALRVTCSEPCRMRARLVAKAGRRSRTVAKTSRRLRADRSTRIVLEVKSKAARRLVRSRRARARLRITASDAAGNVGRLSRGVRLRPR